jgi:hypothetical protein
MKARHRIARPELAALDPVDDGKEADAVAAHPAMDLLGAALQIGPRPGARPMVAGTEFGKAQPIAKRQLTGIADSLPALLRRIDKKHAAEAFARQPAEGVLSVAIEQGHGFAAVQEIERGRNPGDPSADDQDVTVAQSHRRSAPLEAISTLPCTDLQRRDVPKREGIGRTGGPRRRRTRCLRARAQRNRCSTASGIGKGEVNELPLERADRPAKTRAFAGIFAGRAIRCGSRQTPRTKLRTFYRSRLNRFSSDSRQAGDLALL